MMGALETGPWGGGGGEGARIQGEDGHLQVKEESQNRPSSVHSPGGTRPQQPPEPQANKTLLFTPPIL